MRAVANAGPLIHLSWIDRLDILEELFAKVLIPPAVQQEVLAAAPHIPGVAALHAAFEADRLRFGTINDLGIAAALMADLDRGESKAIAPMNETQADILLLDDRRARISAQHLGFPFTGTVGILKMARDRGLISEVVPILEKLWRRGFRIGTELTDEIRREETRGEV